MPALLFYGTKDTIVSPKLMTRDCARIRHSGSDCQSHAYGGAGHGLDPFLPNIDALATRFVLATVHYSSPSTGTPNRPGPTSIWVPLIVAMCIAALSLGAILIIRRRRRAT